MNLAPLRAQVLHAEAALALDLFGVARRAFARFRVEPTDGRVVVVRARVGDEVRVIVVRQVYILRVAAEGELQDAHAGETEVVAQGLNVGRDDAQIFRDDR